MQKIGIVAGSLDPITNGHSWLIQETCALFDKVYVVIAINPDKKGYFTPEERKELTEIVLKSDLSAEDYAKVELVFLEQDFVARFAGEVGAQYIVRGLRNTTDFNYESQIQLVKAKVNPNVRTMYLIPPAHLTAVSSSMVKGLIGLKGWELVASEYVHAEVLTRFKARAALSS